MGAGGQKETGSSAPKTVPGDWEQGVGVSSSRLQANLSLRFQMGKQRLGARVPDGSRGSSGRPAALGEPRHVTLSPYFLGHHSHYFHLFSSPTEEEVLV